ACAKLQDLSEPILILRLRTASSKLFIMTERFDLANLLDYVLASAVQFEKAISENTMYRELLNFHCEISTLIKVLINEAIQQIKYFKWLDHFARVARL
ncbi:34113_t:CDS:2, partial [Racocetra persica]